ncbi:hypothetical protein AB0M43_22200 [Longispora sp. NPDC051575]|uniref:hypothetical protein n=1 Tax=Longispora sp. NPDC051575 TaxID=3154943 RepID=UPI0034353B6A
MGLLSAVVLADRMHPVLAAFVGGLLGAGCAAVAWTLVRTWAVIRVIWWWLPELVVGLVLLVGWVQLAKHTNMVVRLLVVALVVGVPAAVPVVRRWIIAVAMCLVVRHRLRVCFNSFITANRTGSLPLILFAWPTPVGERTWIWLRPGLSISDLESRTDKLATACWCSEVSISKGSSSYAALVRVDLKRRHVLTGQVVSPLVDMVDPNTPATVKPLVLVPEALDLTDVPEAPAVNGTPQQRKRANDTNNQRRPEPDAGDDMADWI